MSYDGRIPTGGNVRSNTGLPDQNDDRKVKGKFKTTTGANRDVSVEEGKSHIPATTGNGPQERLLEDWEIKVQENETLFFSKVSDLLAADEASAGKSQVREELKALHTCMADLLTEYSKRISELAVNDRITQKNLEQIKGPMIRVFQTVKDELVQLEKSLAPNASKAAKKEVKDVLPIAKNQITQANKVLAEAKALLVESTLPPLPEVAEIKVWPVPKVFSEEVQETTTPKKKRFFQKKTEPEAPPSLNKVSSEQRLQNLKQQLRKASPEQVQVILQSMVKALDELKPQLEKHMKNNPKDSEKARKKADFDKCLEIMRAGSEVAVTAANVSSVRTKTRDQLFVLETCIKNITGWEGKVSKKPVKEPATPPLAELKKAKNAHLAASDIHFQPLHEQVEALNAAASQADQKKKLRAIELYIRGQQDRFNRLLPLLQTVAAKCDYEQKEPPVECAHFYEALGKLNKTVNVIRRSALSEEYISAIKEADVALAALDSFDQTLPAPLWRSLTESGSQSEDVTPHLLNLMCRKILNEESGPLSERTSLQKLTDIGSFLDKVQNKKLGKSNDQEISEALNKVVGDGLSTPEKAKELMVQARTLEEAHAVGFELVSRTGMQQEYLDDICKRLDEVAIDFELQGVREGRDKLRELTRYFGTGAARELRETGKGKKTDHRESHPDETVRSFVKEFIRSFETCQKAVETARQHERRINHLISARSRTEAELKKAVSSVEKLQAKGIRRLKKRKVAQKLRQLKSQVHTLNGKSLKDLSEDVIPASKLVLRMVKERQLEAEEAVEVLSPLYTLQQAAKGTTPALQLRTQPLYPEDAQRPKELKAVLEGMEKKYRWGNLWHQLTRPKRLRAVEHARALVKICEECPQAPTANAQMLDSFRDELKKVKSSHPDYRVLKKALSDYALHLQKSSATITYDQINET